MLKIANIIAFISMFLVLASVKLNLPESVTMVVFGLFAISAIISIRGNHKEANAKVKDIGRLFFLFKRNKSSK